MNKMTIKKGNSSDIFAITVSGVSDYADYKGEIAVIDVTGTIVLGKNVILPDVSGFSVALSPAQTEMLDVGSYNVVFEITKEVTGVAEFRRELSWPLKITESLLNN